MAAGIVYLDVDDEITSAAQRIRSSTATRVALVVPYGSRIATSRMNFRLLSREAIVSNRRLSIVSGDAASRAARGLGRPAGLRQRERVRGRDGGVRRAGRRGPGRRCGRDPGGERDDRGGRRRPRRPVAEPGADPARLAEATAAAAGLAAATGRAAAERSRRATTRCGPVRRHRPDGGPARRRGRSGCAAASRRGRAPCVIVRHARPMAPVVRPRSGSAPSRAIEDERLEGRRGPRAPVLRRPCRCRTRDRRPRRSPPGCSSRRRRSRSRPAPSRSPVELTVSADPTVTTADPATGVVPAVRLDVPVEASQTFNTTGVHVEQTPAAGEVTFSNYNPVSSNTVPAGSVVSTEGGIRFRTLAGVTIPAGAFVLPSVIPATRRVAVQAVKPGTEGNVPANAIRVVPQGENPDVPEGQQPEPDRRRHPDRDARDHAGRAGQGGRRSSRPSSTRPSRTRSPRAPAPRPTRRCSPRPPSSGRRVPDPDPKTLVGQAVPTYDLALSATGSVIAVDPRPGQRDRDPAARGQDRRGPPARRRVDRRGGRGGDRRRGRPGVLPGDRPGPADPDPRPGCAPLPRQGQDAGRGRGGARSVRRREGRPLAVVGLDGHRDSTRGST